MTMDSALSNRAGAENAVPPRIIAGRALSRRWTILGAIAAGVALLVLFVFNPADHRFYPQCWFSKVTGVLCPGCGGLRATHQLLHGQVTEAFRLNALFVVSMPVLAVYFGLRCRQRPARGTTGSHRSRRWWWALLAALVLFGMLRNLPGFDWLRP